MSESNTNNEQGWALEANIILRGKIECITGLHIGGSKEKLEIGGVDSPVIRNPRSQFPYIPGSSLKGKIRHLLEFANGVVGYGAENPGDVSQHPDIVRLFGIGAEEKESSKLASIGPTRIIVSDCHPDKATRELWKKMDSELLYTEYKPENGIDRITSAANPRFVERVVEGSFFNFEIIYMVLTSPEGQSLNDPQKDLSNLLKGLRLLEHNFIGKAGSRGYGRIKLHLTDPIVLTPSDYQNGTEAYGNSILDLDSISDRSLKTLKDIKLTYPK